MQVGLQLPSRLGPAALTQRDLLEMAVLADTTPGWDHLWVPDSVLALPFYDSVVSLAACAAVTSRVRLGVACMASLGLRQPLVVAQQWANLDALSGGRMTLVACPGEPAGQGQARELAAFGLTRSQKIERMAETIAFLRAVSSQQPVSFSGRYLSVDGLSLAVPFVQRPLPIWLAANPPAAAPRAVVERLLRRVARLGDGWLTFAVTPGLLAERLTLLREIAEQDGRPLGPGFGVCVYLNVNVHADEQLALADAVATWNSESARPVTADQVRELAAVGTPSRCAEHLAELRRAGATAVVLGMLSADPRRQMRTVTHELLPLLADG
jgi:alkanesulfonate monooxygenase SsuD/methylene tetrahydromethanopterin reductase-like flavin-dependent oxidoreductase (luciferase family)